MLCSHCVVQIKKTSGLKRSTSKSKGQLAPNGNLLQTGNFGGSALVIDYETDESDDHLRNESATALSKNEIKVLVQILFFFLESFKTVL